MNKPLLVIVDADAIVAQSIANDSNHKKVIELSEKLLAAGAHLIFPATTITEAITALQRKFSDPRLAASTLEILTEDGIAIDEVNQKMLHAAKEFFSPQSSKQNTLFDCVVAAVAKKYHADAILSFDTWYQKLGFNLVSDLF